MSRISLAISRRWRIALGVSAGSVVSFWDCSIRAAPGSSRPIIAAPPSPGQRRRVETRRCEPLSPSSRIDAEKDEDEDEMDEDEMDEANDFANGYA